MMDYYHPGGLPYELHRRWLANPKRHVHAMAAEYNSPRVPAPMRAAGPIGSMHDAVVSSFNNMQRFKVSPLWGDGESPSWHNAVRAYEDGQ